MGYRRAKQTKKPRIREPAGYRREKQAKKPHLPERTGYRREKQAKKTPITGDSGAQKSKTGKVKEIKNRWENELSAIYGGELEIDYMDGTYYACAFHNEPKNGCDSWVEQIKEFDCLGKDKMIETECRKLGIPVCS